MVRCRFLFMSKAPFDGTLIPHSLIALSDDSSQSSITSMVALWPMGHHSASIKTPPLFNKMHSFIRLTNLFWKPSHYTSCHQYESPYGKALI